jgi:hypothetical protein
MTAETPIAAAARLARNALYALEDELDDRHATPGALDERTAGALLELRRRWDQETLRKIERGLGDD